MDKSDQDRGKAWARPAYPLFLISRHAASAGRLTDAHFRRTLGMLALSLGGRYHREVSVPAATYCS